MVQLTKEQQKTLTNLDAAAESLYRMEQDHLYMARTYRERYLEIQSQINAILKIGEFNDSNLSPNSSGNKAV